MAGNRRNLRKRLVKAVVLLTAAGVLAACHADDLGYGPKHLREVSSSVKRKIKDNGMQSTSPIMIRIFKEESELEVWKQKPNGRYALLESFEICKWSGKLGPKFKEGDRQAPEGFYEITPALMNPKSSYHLAFNLGYPNRYDRSHGRTGSHLMVHGACSSRGCYAMTDAQVQDIYALARDSFRGGQRSFQVQAFPFKMTPENMARHRGSEHMDFWRMLKTGYDHFEVTKTPPKVAVCEKKYVFDATTLVDGVPFRASAKCPAYKVPERVELLVAAKQRQDQEEFQKVIARLDAKEERKRRWEETQTKLAQTLSGGSREAAPPRSAEELKTTPAIVTQAEAAQPEPTEVGPVPAITTAFAAEPKTPEKKQGFLKRWLPFGSKAEEAPSVDLATSAVPAPKP